MRFWIRSTALKDRRPMSSSFFSRMRFSALCGWSDSRPAAVRVACAAACLRRMALRQRPAARRHLSQQGNERSGILQRACMLSIPTSRVCSPGCVGHMRARNLKVPCSGSGTAVSKPTNTGSGAPSDSLKSSATAKRWSARGSRRSPPDKRRTPARSIGSQPAKRRTAARSRRPSPSTRRTQGPSRRPAPSKRLAARRQRRSPPDTRDTAGAPRRIAHRPRFFCPAVPRVML